MKKIFVLLATGFAVLVLFFFSAVGGSRHSKYAPTSSFHSLSASEDSLAGQEQLERRPSPIVAASPNAQPPAPPSEILGIGGIGTKGGGGGRGTGYGAVVDLKKIVPEAQAGKRPTRSVTMARAIPTRFFIPPDISEGIFLLEVSNPTLFRQKLTRSSFSSIGIFVRTSSGNITFCSTVIESNNAAP